MRKWITGLVIWAMVFSCITTVGASSQIVANGNTGFTDIKMTHWAKADIERAVGKGYVTGYPGGLFKPDQEIKRVEFMKMVVTALDIAIDSATGSWYEPYVKAAQDKQLYVDTDFTNTDDEWNKNITRKEMARIAVRAIGKTGEDDYELMYVATQSGLLSGVSGGKLEPEGTSSRAQAVTIIERISRTLEGEILPVDAVAVANAERIMKAPKDLWGRSIRTTNLPKNYKDYNYILEDIPNEMYELKMSNVALHSPEMLTTVGLYSKYKEQFTKHNIDIWMDHITKYYALMLNVDYKTIDEDWVTKLYAEKIQSDARPPKGMKDYVDWVKKHKVRIEGSLTPEPSIMYTSGGTYSVRSKVKFIIKSADTLDKVFFDPVYNSNYTKLKIGVWYEGYADVEIATNVYGDWGDTLSVYGLSSIFAIPATYKELHN